jgi:hypothetical protein
MRPRAPYFLILLLALQTAALRAQTREAAEPRFALTIAEYHHEFGPTFDRVTVRMTNISNEVITEPGCAQWRGLYVFSVLYNGAPLEEKDAAARRVREVKDAQFCTQEAGTNKIKLGESIDRWFSLSSLYDVSKPGTYEVTVLKETDPKPDASRPGTYLERAPGDPDRSVTVKSNTLTIVVPERETDAPK